MLFPPVEGLFRDLFLGTSSEPPGGTSWSPFGFLGEETLEEATVGEGHPGGHLGEDTLGEEDTLGVEDTLGRTPWGRRTPWGGHPGDINLLVNPSLTYQDPSRNNLKSENESISLKLRGDLWEMKCLSSPLRRGSQPAGVFANVLASPVGLKPTSPFPCLEPAGRGTFL